MVEAEDKQESVREFKPLLRQVGETQTHLAKVV